MAKYVIEDTILTNTANAIREKTGKTDTITPSNFATEIAGIQSGGDTTQEDGLIEGTLTEYSNDRVTSVGDYVFYEKDNLTSIELPNVENIGISSIYYCTNLKSLNVPKLITIKKYSVRDLTNLTFIDLPNLTTLGESSFYRNTSLSKINIPKVTDIPNGCFQYCNGLTSTEDFSNIKTMGDNCFANCSSLTIVNFPNLTTTGSYCFQNNSKLETAIFPNLTRFSAFFLSSCSLLKKVVLGNMSSIPSVNGILQNTALDTLIIQRTSSICTLNCSYGSVFKNSPIANGTGYIYVPSALIEEYKTATNWAVYADQFRAIEDYPDICGEVA